MSRRGPTRRRVGVGPDHFRRLQMVGPSPSKVPPRRGKPSNYQKTRRLAHVGAREIIEPHWLPHLLGVIPAEDMGLRHLDQRIRYVKVAAWPISRASLRSIEVGGATIYNVDLIRAALGML